MINWDVSRVLFIYYNLLFAFMCCVIVRRVPTCNYYARISFGVKSWCWEVLKLQPRQHNDAFKADWSFIFGWLFSLCSRKQTTHVTYFINCDYCTFSHKTVIAQSKNWFLLEQIWMLCDEWLKEPHFWKLHPFDLLPLGARSYFKMCNSYAAKWY